MYKPLYCCSCGDRIDRIEWNLLTNRRFCELCETEHRANDLLRRFAAVALLMIGVFGVGSYMASSERIVEIRTPKTNANPYVISKRSDQLRSVEKRKKDGKKDLTRDPKTESGTKKPPEQQLRPPADDDLKPIAPKKSLQKVTSEPVYFCGAATKKGTGCSRRVKGGGRCWQHKGRKALLEEKELYIEN